MSWSILHFKQHVDPVLCNDIELQLRVFKKEEEGGPLCFFISMDENITSNEQSLLALEGTVKIYNITIDGEDGLPTCIKLLRVVTRFIVAMQADGSNWNALPVLFVVDIINVLQTTSVQPFTDKMEQFHDNIEFRQFDITSSTSFNTSDVLDDVYSFAHQVYTKMFNLGTWQDELLSKPKSSFNIYWKNRCWNYEQEDYNKYRCPTPPNKERIDENQLAWKEENNKGNTNNNNTNNDTKRKKPHHQWRSPIDDKKNKCFIHGKPYTLNGKNSTIEDSTLDSDLESPSNIANATGAATIAITG